MARGRGFSRRQATVAIVIVAVIAWPSGWSRCRRVLRQSESPRVAEAVALSSPPAAEIERPQAAPRASAGDSRARGCNADSNGLCR